MRLAGFFFSLFSGCIASDPLFGAYLLLRNAPSGASSRLFDVFYRCSLHFLAYSVFFLTFSLHFATCLVLFSPLRRFSYTKRVSCYLLDFFDRFSLCLLRLSNGKYFA